MVSRIRLYILPFLKVILRTVPKLLSLFGYSSKIFGPPKGSIQSIDQLMQQRIDKSKIIFKNFLSSVTINEPFNYNKIKKYNIEKLHIFKKTEFRLISLEKGRYHLKPHAFISSNDMLIFSDSCCYGMNPKEHWIFNQIKLSKCKILPGSSFMLGGKANYWHLLSEELPYLYWFKKNGFNINNFDHLIVNSIKHNFQKEIYELFEIPQNKFVHLETYPHIQSDRLVYFTPTYQPDMEALAWVRDTILNSIDKNISTEKRIYISRQTSNSKRIKNHEEIIPLLEKFDFKIIKPEEMTLFEQVETFHNANFVIGAHGAALANLMFCKPDTNVIEIRSSLHRGSFAAPFVYMWYKELNNLKYSLLLSEIDESFELKGRSKMDSDLVIDIVEFETLIKLHLD